MILEIAPDIFKGLRKFTLRREEYLDGERK